MLRRFLFLFLTLSTSLLPSWAQNPQLQAGEIALEGTLESLDVVKNSLVLRATSFTGVSGASKPLPQPKSKAIQLDETTQFVELGGLKNLSLGDLEKGQQIRVVGRETAGKSFAARLIAWTALDPRTPRQKAPFLPAPQTQNGMTLRILDAGFTKSIFARDNEEDKRLDFYFSYTLPDALARQSGSAEGTPEADLQTRFLQVSGPNGEPVSSYYEQPQRDGNGSQDSQGVRIVSSWKVNPAWKYLVAEWETLDPNAPSDAAGRFESTLAFDKVAVPPQSGQKMPVDVKKTTARGSTITLKSVRVEKADPAKFREANTYFDFEIAAPLAVPDMTVELDLKSIEDENGIPWSYQYRNNLNGLSVQLAPPPGTTMMAPTLKIKESAPSLKKREWYRRFRVEIPVAALLPFAPPPAQTSAPVWKAQGKAFSVEVEHEAIYQNRNWNAVVWLKPRVPSPDPTQRWMLREVKAISNGKETRGLAYLSAYAHRFWHFNGSLAAPDEHSNTLSVTFRPPPEKFDLELKVERARRLEGVGWIRRVPLPAEGASLDIGAGQLENDNVRIKRIFWPSRSELARLNREYFKRSVAIVVELPPTFPGAEVEIRGFRVQDDRGRDMDVPQASQEGDVGRAKTGNSTLRTLIIQVPLGIKSLDLWFKTLELTWSGQSETVVLKDVAGK